MGSGDPGVRTAIGSEMVGTLMTSQDGRASLGRDRILANGGARVRSHSGEDGVGNLMGSRGPVRARCGTVAIIRTATAGDGVHLPTQPSSWSE